MYGYTKNVKSTFEETVPRVKEALMGEGFGVLTEIDVKSTLRKKLDVGFRKYIILGACNPPLAYQALSEEIDIGLLCHAMSLFMKMMTAAVPFPSLTQKKCSPLWNEMT